MYIKKAPVPINIQDVSDNYQDGKIKPNVKQVSDIPIQETIYDNHVNLKIESRDGKLNFDQLADTEKIINSDIIILAGFMPIVPRLFIKQYGKLMLNTHPSLLPKHGGKGMYGVSV